MGGTLGNTLEAARHYHEKGYRPVPIPAKTKGPRVKDWPNYQFDAATSPRDFPIGSNIGIIMGGGLVCVDFDHERALVIAPQFLPATGCVIGRPGRPRCHWFYRLADGELLKNKSWKAKVDGKAVNLIDLLNDGKQVVVGPSVHPSGDIYEDLVGEPATVTADELMAAITALVSKARGDAPAEPVRNAGPEPAAVEAVAPPPTPQRPAANSQWQVRPGDDYNARADIRGLLIRHGWTQVKEGDNEHWRRPGKTDGTSATLRSAREFYNFSSNSPGLMPDKCYSPFALFAALEHRGDFTEATRALIADGYGEQLPAVDLSGFTAKGGGKPPPTMIAQEPFPVDCLMPPGLIGDIIRHNLRTASNPQPILALSGALALMSVILGNKVRSFPNHHTYGNLFILALAPSAGGKDHARKLNREILDDAGVGHLRGAESIGSGPGIPAALARQSVLLMQIDEISDLLVQMKNGRSAYLSSISQELKKIKTSAGSVYKGSALVHEENLKVINNPYLVLYGTTTGTGFWDAVTTSQVTDGLLGRFIIFEATGYAKQRDALSDDVPIDILDRVKWWANLVTHEGNLAVVRPKPILLEHTPEAKSRAIGHAKAVNAKQIVEHKDDPLRAAIWGRTAENTNQLALLFACSRMLAGALPGDIDRPPPVIELADVDLAVKLSNWLTRNMVRKITGHVGENEWEIMLKKMLRAIPDEGISQSGLRRQFRMLKGRELPDALGQLVEGGDIGTHSVPGGGRTGTWFYRTASGYMPPGAG